MTVWLLYPPNPHLPKPRVTARRVHVVKVHAHRHAATVRFRFLGQEIEVEAPFSRLARGAEKFHLRRADLAREAALNEVPAVAHDTEEAARRRSR